MNGPQPTTPHVLRVDGFTRSGTPTHHYETRDGEKVPGVTTILSRAIPKPALVNWASNTAAAYAVDNWDELHELTPTERYERIKKEWRGQRDKAAARGTEVHQLAEALAHGHDVDVPDELMPYVQPYAQWLQDFDVHPIDVETVVYSLDPLYAGTLDLIAHCRMPGGAVRRLLIDIKTSGSGVWPETAMQLTYYQLAQWMIVGNVAQPMTDVDGLAVVHLNGDGDYTFVPATPVDVETLFGVYELAQWVQQPKPSIIGRPISAATEAVE